MVYFIPFTSNDNDGPHLMSHTWSAGPPRPLIITIVVPWWAVTLSACRYGVAIKRQF